MASATREGRGEGVAFEQEDGGSITAIDIETGVARDGDTGAEVLSRLAEVLQLEAGGGEPVTDEDFKQMGLGPEAEGDKELPNLIK